MQETLEESLTGSALTLAYQPLAELATGSLRGFEALVRWPRPVQETVAPEELTELAEETGLIVPLGWWAIRGAITDKARWLGPDADPLWRPRTVRSIQGPAGMRLLRGRHVVRGAAASARGDRARQQANPAGVRAVLQRAPAASGHGERLPAWHEPRG